MRDIGTFQNSGQIVDLVPASAIHMSQLPSHTCFSRVLWCISNPSCLHPSLYFLSSLPALAQTWGAMRCLAGLAGFCNTSLTPAADDLISHLKSLLSFSPQAALKSSFILLLVPSLFLPLPTGRYSSILQTMNRLLACSQRGIIHLERLRACLQARSPGCPILTLLFFLQALGLLGCNDRIGLVFLSGSRMFWYSQVLYLTVSLFVMTPNYVSQARRESSSNQLALVPVLSIAPQKVKKISESESFCLH